MFTVTISWLRSPKQGVFQDVGRDATIRTRTKDTTTKLAEKNKDMVTSIVTSTDTATDTAMEVINTDSIADVLTLVITGICFKERVRTSRCKCRCNNSFPTWASVSAHRLPMQPMQHRQQPLPRLKPLPRMLPLKLRQTPTMNSNHRGLKTMIRNLQWEMECRRKKKPRRKLAKKALKTEMAPRLPAVRPLQVEPDHPIQLAPEVP